MIVVRVRDQASHGPKNREGFDLEMGCMLINVFLVDSDIRVVLFVDVQVLDDSSRKSIIEVHCPFTKALEES